MEAGRALYRRLPCHSRSCGQERGSSGEVCCGRSRMQRMGMTSGAGHRLMSRRANFILFNSCIHFFKVQRTSMQR